MYIGLARNNEEFVAAQELAIRTWNSNSDNQEKEYKDLVWMDPSFISSSHLIVMVSDDGIVFGVTRLLPRRLRRGSQVIKVGGISSVCIQEDQRGKGLSKKLIMATIDHAKTLECEIVVLFARRAVDDFYTRFDIWGIASYTSAQVFLKKKNYLSSQSSRLRSFHLGDINALSKWHQSSYSKSFGWFERTPEHWNYLVKKSSLRGFDIKIFEVEGKDCGYVITKNCEVVEIGLDSSPDPNVCSELLVRELGQLKMNIPSDHTLISMESRLDISITIRRCIYGGHMVGIIDKQSLCLKLAKQIKTRAEIIGIKSKKEVCDGLLMEWDGKNASVSLASTDKTQYGPLTTARLIGACIAGRGEESILAPGLPLNFLTLDEF